MSKRIVSVVAAAAALLGPVTAFAAGAGPATAEQRARWDTRVFSRVPNPGYPAFVYAHPNGRVYAGTYTDPKGDTVRSRVLEWTADGTLLRSWTCRGRTCPTSTASRSRPATRGDASSSWRSRGPGR